METHSDLMKKYMSDIEIKEYEEKLKQEARERSKLYYQNNKQYVKERIKIWIENNKEKYDETARKYYENNRQNILLKGKEYRQINRVKIEENYGMKILCECGCHIRKDSLRNHLKTKKHNKLMEAKK